MNRGEFIFEISRSFGLDDTTSSDELILMQRWYTRAVKDVLIKTHCFLDFGNITLTPGVTDYRLDSLAGAGVLALESVTAPDAMGASVELQIVTMSEIIPYLSPSVAASSVPTRVAAEGSLLRVAPRPSSAVVLTYLYVPKPAEVASDGSLSFNSTDPSTATYGGIADEYHDCILAYMKWQAADYDDKTTALNAKDYRSAYEGLCKDVRKQHRRKGGRGLTPARVGYPGTRGPSGRNDVYPNYSR